MNGIATNDDVKKTSAYSLMVNESWDLLEKKNIFHTAFDFFLWNKTGDSYGVNTFYRVRYQGF